MQQWIIATLIGAGLGLLLYGCVRLRMHFGPLLRERYGNWARQLCWVVIIALMVALANVTLLLLRYLLGDTANGDSRLVIEIWFALLALTVAMLLVFRRVKRDA